MQLTALVFLSVLFISFSLINAQAVYDILAPSTSIPARCQKSHGKSFTIIQALEPPNRIDERTDDLSIVVMSLHNSILVDRLGRIGSIVANRQFQFDGPPAQAGAIYTAGWGVCPDEGILVLGGQTIFFSCASGNFSNLYDQSIDVQCTPVYLGIQNVV